MGVRVRAGVPSVCFLFVACPLPVMPSPAVRAVSTHASDEANLRLESIRKVAWVLDRSIPIGGGRRIGLDPILGLIPGLGDWLGALISVFVVYQAIRLGLPLAVLGKARGRGDHPAYRQRVHRGRSHACDTGRGPRADRAL